jgi:predicted transcriptional regulator
MENKNQGNEIQIELSEEISQGIYSNLAIIAHSSSEFIIDFIRLMPGTPKAKVQSRIILTPDNAKRLLYALQDNIEKFEEQKNTGKTVKFEDVIPPIGGVKGEA